MTSAESPAIFVIAGMQGAGKSTVGRLLAETLPRCAFIETDELTKFVVSGRLWPERRDWSDEADRQLRLRLHNACLLARSFVDAGFSAVIDDFIMGSRLDHLLEEMDGTPFHFVMLIPTLEVVIEREHGRGTRQYENWSYMDHEVKLNTRRLGLWLDSSAQTPAQTVDEILRRRDEALVR